MDKKKNPSQVKQIKEKFTLTEVDDDSNGQMNIANGLIGKGPVWNDKVL